MNHYRIFFEKVEQNFSASSPDLPGCKATEKTREGIARNMEEAIELPFKGIVEDQPPNPAPQLYASYFSTHIY